MEYHQILGGFNLNPVLMSKQNPVLQPVCVYVDEKSEHTFLK